MMLLSRVMEFLLETDGIGRTALAQKTKINYSRLFEHIRWLEDKEMIELIIKSGKVHVRLTESGREFAIRILNRKK